jgi:hypothetical protein
MCFEKLSNTIRENISNVMQENVSRESHINSTCSELSYADSVAKWREI